MAKSNPTPKTSIITLETEAENTLFAKLKAKRLEIAKAHKIPPFMIFHDRTLLEMTKQKPKTPQELRQISGIGETKLKNYGEDFLAVIVSN
jgi:ATP-dependent DNA helicase RecQ